jgi:hypothetical protein
MNPQILYLAAALATLFGAIVFKINKKKYGIDLTSGVQPDITRKYSFRPNAKIIKREWALMGMLGLGVSIYVVAQHRLESWVLFVKCIAMMAGFFGGGWVLIFLLFNSRKIEIDEVGFEVSGFIFREPVKIEWSNIQKAKLILQNKVIKIEERPPTERQTRAAIKKYGKVSESLIIDLISANLQDRGILLDVDYW